MYRSETIALTEPFSDVEDGVSRVSLDRMGLRGDVRHAGTRCGLGEDALHHAHGVEGVGELGGETPDLQHFGAVGADDVEWLGEGPRQADRLGDGPRRRLGTVRSYDDGTVHASSLSFSRSGLATVFPRAPQAPGGA